MKPAEKFAKEFAKAMAIKPTDLVVDGVVIATVTSDGKCSISSAHLSYESSQALVQWIAENY